MEIVELERGDRALRSTRHVEPNELIFSDTTPLHTLHPYGHTFRPFSSIPLALDWQRLLFIWLQLLSRQDSVAIACRDELRTDGVTSDLARAQDPDRVRAYRQCAIEFCQKMKKRGKVKRGHGWPSMVGDWRVEMVERCIGIVETNCHAREWRDVAGKPSMNLDCWDAEEEFVGVWPVASLMDHSCRPNATCEISLNEDGTIARLDVRALREVQPGDGITISYHDEEFMPTELRQRLLAKRGFRCECELCREEVDVARWFVCRRDGCGGVVRGLRGGCGRCDRCLIPFEVDGGGMEEEMQVDGDVMHMLLDYIVKVQHQQQHHEGDVGIPEKWSDGRHPMHYVFHVMVEELMGEDGSLSMEQQECCAKYAETCLRRYGLVKEEG